VSEQEYLATAYRPDCDYVDGVLLERNVGQFDHSDVQGELARWFRNRRHQLGMSAFPELRVAVKPKRYRVPDVCVVKLPRPSDPVLKQAPYICIEILSPEDTFPRLQERLDDYLDMGAENIWVIDPISRRGWVITRQGHLEALDAILRTGDSVVVLPIAELFSPD
jgi:Uma2 family endonuclease